MLGIGLFPQWWMQPALLLIGALWYNLLTFIGHLMFPVRPVQEQLAASFSPAGALSGSQGQSV